MTAPLDPAVAAAACAGPWRPGLVAIRIARARGHLLVSGADRALADLLVASFPDGADAATVTRLLGMPEIARWWAETDGVEPAASGPGPLRVLRDAGRVAALLDVPLGELHQLARWHRPEADSGPVRAQHYRYHVRPTRHGGVRVIEAPKERLKEVQRRILRRVLADIPVHPAAHGATPGRGVVDAIGLHTARDVVTSLDIERFFTAVTDTRVTGWFVRLGADREAARLLARLLTNAVPVAIRRELPPVPGERGPDLTWWRDRQLAARHLPQGAPSSPAVADRLCFGLDRRLSALAAHRDLTYTRYVDDLTFSGDAAVDTDYLIRTVETIVRDEGFRVSAPKTRVQRSSGRQRVLGAVVNGHATLPRAERDAVKAIVHNCRVHGWRSQVRDEPSDGFRERLTGRVAWLAALDPVRGRRLRAELDAVDWT